MRPSRFSTPAVALFEAGFRRWMRARLAGVHLAATGEDLSAGGPLLLVANHGSWWDPFLVRELQRRLRPGAPMYTLMLRSELERRPPLRWLGVVPIDGRDRGSVLAAVRFLRDRVAAEPRASVLIFPQGRIWPSHRRPLGFRRGVETFARRLDARIVPLGIHLEPLNRVAPTAFLCAGDPLAPLTAVERVEEAVEMELDRIHSFLAAHGEDAPARWPPPKASPA